jgi:CRP-like cAMP-binding protein
MIFAQNDVPDKFYILFKGKVAVLVKKGDS